MIKTENDLQAFEIQDLNNMAKFVYLYDPSNEVVAMYCTSDRKSVFVVDILQGKFPFGCINAWEYFRQVWQKSLLFNTFNIKFLHWVHPRTFEVIE
jgi:hypothetical protein